MHIATKIGLVYGVLFLISEWSGYQKPDHVTLAMVAVFFVGSTEDSKKMVEERKKREKIIRDYDEEQRNAGRREQFRNKRPD